MATVEPFNGKILDALLYSEIFFTLDKSKNLDCMMGRGVQSHPTK